MEGSVRTGINVGNNPLSHPSIRPIYYVSSSAVWKLVTLPSDLARVSSLLQILELQQRYPTPLLLSLMISLILFSSILNFVPPSLTPYPSWHSHNVTKIYLIEYSAMITGILQVVSSNFRYSISVYYLVYYF
jgi:hypothetical protein